MGKEKEGQEFYLERHSTWRPGNGYNDPQGSQTLAPSEILYHLLHASPAEGRKFKPAWVSRRRALWSFLRDFDEGCSSLTPKSLMQLRDTQLPPAGTTGSASFFLHHLIPYKSFFKVNYSKQNKTKISFKFRLGLFQTQPFPHGVAIVNCI